MPTIREQLLALADTDRPGVRWREGELTWREYVAAARDRAAALAATLDPGRPPHVGVLLENTPEMAVQLAAAGLGGHVLVGLNTTRRGAALAADVRRADCQLVVTDEAHRDLLREADVRVVTDLPAATAEPPTPAPADDSLFMLVFTSGTSGDPKAVRVTHEKVTFPGLMLADRFELGEADTCYVSMPLFHSNAVMAGWGPALAAGATIALAERFTASGFIDDLRHFGATYANYVGKPLAHVLATAERDDDGDNPLRVAFGNEASERDIDEFARRFDCVVWDGFGSTENAVVVTRVPDTPPGSIGQPLDGVAVLDPGTGVECPPAEYDDTGAVTNLDTCVGELVNVQGAGQFAGYYNDEAATAERLRGGMYWSGDLAYRDAAGFVYYAGRTSDWLRVDGENLAAAPVERILLRHPAVSEAAVYGVPDPSSGDRLVAALVLRDDLGPDAFEAFLGAQTGLGPKQWPRHVRVLAELPRTATNKVLKRELRAEGLTGPSWTRDERGTTYRTD
ncbi:MAG: long-chain-fatty-acid--CoA ligase [Marmoricola sp.]